MRTPDYDPRPVDPPAGPLPPLLNSRHVRAWAKAHGWPQLGDRGRLPQDAIDQYMQEISA